MTQIIEISTQYQLANIAALIRSGRLGAAGERRILVVANNSFAPELTPAADAMPGSVGLLEDFDLVVDWNAVIWPNHPKAFGISNERGPIMERALRREWDIAAGEPLELIVESLPSHPAGALTAIFATAAISVHSDGLMSYGPIRNPLTLPQFQRLWRICYTDLLPGITPRQLAEHCPERLALPVADLREVFAEMTAEAAPQLAEAKLAAPIDGAGLVLGQYLAQLDLITAEEELGLHLQMIEAVKDRGCETVIFKPHPTSARATVEPLRRRSRELGLDFVLADVPLLAEIVIGSTAPDLVVSCFSTGLVTARGLYGCDTAAIGTTRLLQALSPYQNSNRIPLTIIDALHTGGYALPGELAEVGSSARTGLGTASAETKDLNALIDAVTYCMQPRSASYLRENTVDFLDSVLGDSVFDDSVFDDSASGGEDMKYFKRRRLTKLALPGAVQAPLHRKALSSAKRGLLSRARRTQQRLKSYGVSIDVSKLRKNG